jgi:superoxide dismutase, Fe-Mn family
MPASAALKVASPHVARNAPPFELGKLPYAADALAPVISANTIGFHHGKHHQTYVTNLNNLVKEGPLAGKSLVEVIMASAGKAELQGVFNNAAQVWNHDFYWASMAPKGGGAPKGKLKEKIDSDLGGFEGFKKEFAAAGAGQFGSGWAWLVLDGGKLKVTKTPNAELPFTKGAVPLITMDVWEHAYYLDFQNRRPDYIAAWLDKLVNWDFAAENLAKAG